MGVLLETRGLTKRFYGLTTVDAVDFTVEEGTIVGLIGPNGSGKTTTFDCLTGFQSPTAGTVRFDGRDITRRRPDEISRSGLTRTFQHPRVYPRHTVLENLLMALQQFQEPRLLPALLMGPRMQRLEREGEERARELLEFVGLSRVMHLPAGTLSYGQKKLLALAGCLISDPRLILLDEPVAGVNPTLVEGIKERILRLNGEGRTFLIVEHNMHVIMEICHKVIVLDSGRKIAEGPPELVQQDERVFRAYFGSTSEG